MVGSLCTWWGCWFERKFGSLHGSYPRRINFRPKTTARFECLTFLHFSPSYQISRFSSISSFPFANVLLPPLTLRIVWHWYHIDSFSASSIYYVPRFEIRTQWVEWQMQMSEPLYDRGSLHAVLLHIAVVELYSIMPTSSPFSVLSGHCFGQHIWDIHLHLFITFHAYSLYYLTQERPKPCWTSIFYAVCVIPHQNSECYVHQSCVLLWAPSSIAPWTFIHVW